MATNSKNPKKVVVAGFDNTQKGKNTGQSGQVVRSNPQQQVITQGQGNAGAPPPQADPTAHGPMHPSMRKRRPSA